MRVSPPPANSPKLRFAPLPPTHLERGLITAPTRVIAESLSTRRPRRRRMPSRR
jgi:hypothetical protein